MDETIRRMLPKEYLERQRLYEEEIADLGGARKDGRVEVSLRHFISFVVVDVLISLMSTVIYVYNLVYIE